MATIYKGLTTYTSFQSHTKERQTKKDDSSILLLVAIYTVLLTSDTFFLEKKNGQSGSNGWSFSGTFPKNFYWWLQTYP